MAEQPYRMNSRIALRPLQLPAPPLRRSIFIQPLQWRAVTAFPEQKKILILLVGLLPELVLVPSACVSQGGIDIKALYSSQLLGLQRQLLSSLDLWLTRCHNASFLGIRVAGVPEAFCYAKGRYGDSLRNWFRCAKPAVIPDAFSNQASHIPQDRLAQQLDRKLGVRISTCTTDATTSQTSTLRYGV